ncbi:MAG TPA: type II toxin-antitoxin system VapC family toxin [Gemmataceae bacterium]|jgi:PIN domain nuclease of toxin-antitoxin system
MKLLLDTHTFLWLIEGNPNLSAVAQTALTNPANELFLSVASVWELAIKTGNKKLTLSDPLDIFIAKWTATYQLDLLPIQTPHALAVVGLPDHHKDPFDRILIAQVRTERLTLVSGDSKFIPYGVPIIW